jgi:hypothetical protein
VGIALTVVETLGVGEISLFIIAVVVAAQRGA